MRSVIPELYIVSLYCITDKAKHIIISLPPSQETTIIHNVPTEVYNPDNKTRTKQEALTGLAVVQQYIGMIIALQGSGLNSTELELYRLFLHAILTDVCEWVCCWDTILVIIYIPSIDCGRKTYGPT